jgi:hypothetical protein
MGTFKIEITGVGAHGVDRNKENGETVNFLAEGDTTADFIAKSLIKQLASRFEQYGIVLQSAELIHWPDEPGEVRDNLITGIRSGSFNPTLENPATEQDVLDLANDLSNDGQPVSDFNPESGDFGKN